MSCGESRRPNGRVATAFGQPVRIVLLFALDALLPFGQRPPDVDLIDADAVAVQARGGVARQRHQTALRHRVRPSFGSPM